MEFTDTQRLALQNAQQILDSVGLSPRDLNDDSVSNASTPRAATPPSSSCSPSPVILCSQYEPPPACFFTPDEVSRKLNKVNRLTSVHARVEHPVGALVEYPQTGAIDGQSVAHIFAVDPKAFQHPRLSFQYSTGDGHGGRPNVKCFLLRDDAGMPVVCYNLKTSCDRSKLSSLLSSISTAAPPAVNSAEKEVFMKTFAFYCALRDKGCAFESDDSFSSQADDPSPDYVDADANSDNDTNFGCISASRRPAKDNKCKGKLVILVDKYQQPFIQCQFRSQSHRHHLVLRSLQEYDTQYLRALLENDTMHISEHKNNAKRGGYGPLVPCTFVASPVEQKQRCSHWHRRADGQLRQGLLEKWQHHCQSKYDIYVPNDLSKCPHVVVICMNPHSHPPPAPIKTPPPLVDLFRSILLRMEWKLADATPRRIVLDSGFMQGLRQELGWSLSTDRDPSLHDLHPSLGNLDHVRRLINTLRNERFPNGTGFDGAILLAKEHEKLPLEQRYVRCAETHSISTTTSEEFKLVICMSNSMSKHLQLSKRLSIDTSFKRLHGWQEFEIETWDLDHSRSVVGARAFTTSQSAEAHFILFRRIFEIVEQDTGVPATFYHIHGTGFESVVADGHKGQGLGLGLYCQYLCRTINLPCMYEPSRQLSELDPYDHLRRFYRLCVTHFKRNILALKGQVSEDAYIAMLSLATSEPHPNIDLTLEIIRRGSKKAAAWLKDKTHGTKFALPAVYRPKSLIPLEIWKASPSTTNGNEQAHRNINASGKLVWLYSKALIYMCYYSYYSTIIAIIALL
ncbi:hypothetical protein BJ138DRAFT_1019827 [Hygrophoropsis aurantiaca]|uniref:Uncharacterized protein n=1 Tax=Hygrophoropsis aurantiaca TaxID=72124 RepID=A0ACB7ZS74_9AGAM|nr:hypothetical protein BJ138DRAFT_1019827 [Hygrophoropsis aurantiaca]